MKAKILIILLFVFTSGISQENKLFISVGLDPAIAVDKNRPGGGNLNYLLRAGIELPFSSSNKNPLRENGGFVVSVFYERFSELYFQAGGLNLGIYKNWSGWEIAGYDLNRWTTTVSFEQGFISRNGIVGALDIAQFKRNEYRPYFVGFNTRIRYEFTDWAAAEYSLQWRQRPDESYYYNGPKQSTLSGFFSVFIYVKELFKSYD